MTDLYYPLRSLREGHWFKLICGASFQHLPSVRNLVLAYALAGADCVDVAADPAVILAARTALEAAAAMQPWVGGSGGTGSPWLMVSFNDGEDPHFRKAEFDPACCPPDCLRPCQQICPAQAIAFYPETPQSGVLRDRCYGCGRCLPICPVQNIAAHSHISTPTAIAPLVLELGVDAIEIHTQVGRLNEFRRVWAAIAPWATQLKLLAISCPDGLGYIDYLWALYETIAPLPCALVWQTDGRPMSGDIGAGATKAAVRLSQKVLTANLPGYVQLAGGTNAHTVAKLKASGLLNPTPASPVTTGTYVAGVAYGSYARSLLLPVLNQFERMTEVTRSVSLSSAILASTPSLTGAQRQSEPALVESGDSLSIGCLETVPELLRQAVDLATSLVSPLKSSSPLVPPMPE